MRLLFLSLALVLGVVFLISRDRKLEVEFEFKVRPIGSED
jgi:hypothetical protein